MKEYDSLSDNEKRNMLASVANLYYNVEMTQNQIAERFFTSRSKISRMLKEARQLGIVEIKILEPWDRNVELEQECKDSRERFLGSFERTCLCIWWNVSLHLCTIVCKLGRSQGQS